MSKNVFDNKIIGMLAFIAIVVYGASTLISLVGGNLGFLGSIGTICLLLATFLSAWNFVQNKANIWKVIYLVILIFAIVMFFWPFIF